MSPRAADRTDPRTRMLDFGAALNIRHANRSDISFRQGNATGSCSSSAIFAGTSRMSHVRARRREPTDLSVKRDVFLSVVSIGRVDLLCVVFRKRSRTREAGWGPRLAPPRRESRRDSDGLRATKRKTVFIDLAGAGPAG